MPDHRTYINHTKKWLSDVIIEYSFCPFAKREFDAGRIHYAVITAADLPRQIDAIFSHCVALDQDAARETTLLIFPTGLSDFETYLDLLELANALLENQNYLGLYQLASFHPDYRFDGTAHDDPGNYTNRSPYPMLHILREASVEVAVKNHPNAEAIPNRNIELTRELGLDSMQDLLAACYK